MKKQETTTEKTKVESKMIQKFRSGQITATIFERETVIKVDGKDKTIKQHNVKVCKSYSLDNGKTWKETDSYQKDDLVKVSVVLNKATEFLYLNEE